MSFRRIVTEKDLSSFARGVNIQTGGFNIVSTKGPSYPVFCTSQEQYLNWFGEPTAEKWGGYEVLQYLLEAPAWVTSSIGSGALHAGIDVTSNSVRGFGSDTGRNPLSFDLQNIQTQLTYKPVSQPGNGIQSVFSFTLPIPLVSTFDPSSSGHFKVKVGSRDIIISSVSPSPPDQRLITGDAFVVNSSTVDTSTGEVTLEFAGNPGTVAKYTSLNILTGGVNLAGAKPKAFNLNIDGTSVTNLVLGTTGNASATTIVNVINSALVIAGLPDGLATLNVDDKIVITGVKADPVFGKITLSPPTDFINYDNAISLIFDSTYTGGSLSQTTNAVSPSSSSYIPRNGEEILVSYIVTEDLSNEVSHSFFATSPYNDSDFTYLADISYVKDRIYNMTLLRRSNIGDVQLATYQYSLDKVNNSQNQSIYIFDVFKNNPFVTPIVNTSYTSIATLQGFSDAVILTGGRRGGTPNSSSIYNSWQPFRRAKRYKIKTFVDLYGNSTGYIKDIITSSQKYAFGISPIPLGTLALDAISYRQNLNIDNANLALYTNWIVIEDIFNGGGLIYVSGMGKVAIKYAESVNVYNAESPAGIDENGLGGSLNKGYQIIDVENDYTDAELELLDNAQINPILKDDRYGVIISGDRTLQVAESDTSFVGARRLYNYILENIVDNILPLQEFRLNDQRHRDKMRSLILDIMNPILVDGYLAEFEVVCDESNNTPDVLNRREFVIDIYVKVTPNSQKIKLNFIRISQTQSLAQVIGTV